MGVKIGILAAAALLLLVIILQNSGPVTLRFLFWGGTAPSALLILLTGTLGFVVGFVAAKLGAATGRRASR